VAMPSCVWTSLSSGMGVHEAAWQTEGAHSRRRQLCYGWMPAVRSLMQQWALPPAADAWR
jgi:hypothetical protein